MADLKIQCQRHYGSPCYPKRVVAQADLAAGGRGWALRAPPRKVRALTKIGLPVTSRVVVIVEFVDAGWVGLGGAGNRPGVRKERGLLGGVLVDEIG